jgi:ketosteroid isomerase-like protein
MPSWDLSAVSAVARRWEVACVSADTESIVSLLSEDAAVWYNFERVEHGRKAYAAILDASRLTFRNARYRDFRVLLHPGGFVEQATLEGDTDAGVMTTPFCLVATVAGGRITRIEEYFDTTPASPAS